MGFRNIHCFNMAMLAEQGWRLLTATNTRFAKLFKAKCFRNKDFMDASLGRRPGYVWKSINASISLLKNGIH